MPTSSKGRGCLAEGTFKRWFSSVMGDLGRAAGEFGSRSRGSRERRHFLPRLQFPTGAKEEEPWRRGSPPFSRLCGAVAFKPRHQFPLPFPPCPQHVSPLTQAVKILPGLLESLWGGRGPFKHPGPWYLRCQVLHPHPTPCLPASSQVGPRESLVEMLVWDRCSFQTTPQLPSSQFFSSTHHLYPGHPKDKLELESYGAKGHLSRLPQPHPGPKSGSSHPRYSAQLGDVEKVTGPGLVCWSPAPRHHHPWLWPTEQVL